MQKQQADHRNGISLLLSIHSTSSIDGMDDNVEVEHRNSLLMPACACLSGIKMTEKDGMPDGTTASAFA
jgi:hypothetical protein